MCGCRSDHISGDRNKSYHCQICNLSPKTNNTVHRKTLLNSFVLRDEYTFLASSHYLKQWRFWSIRFSRAFFDGIFSRNSIVLFWKKKLIWENFLQILLCVGINMLNEQRMLLIMCHFLQPDFHSYHVRQYMLYIYNAAFPTNMKSAIYNWV